MSDPMWTEEELKQWEEENLPYPERMRTKRDIVWRALDLGLRIPMDGMLIAMAGEDFEGDGIDSEDLGFISTLEKDGEQHEMFTRLDITVGAFKQMCDRLPTKALIIIAANSAMRSIALEKVRAREKSLAKKRSKH